MCIYLYFIWLLSHKMVTKKIVKTLDVPLKAIVEKTKEQDEKISGRLPWYLQHGNIEGAAGNSDQEMVTPCKVTTISCISPQTMWQRCSCLIRTWHNFQKECWVPHNEARWWQHHVMDLLLFSLYCGTKVAGFCETTGTKTNSNTMTTQSTNPS